jgi:hypothetical protein
LQLELAIIAKHALRAQPRVATSDRGIVVDDKDSRHRSLQDQQMLCHDQMPSEQPDAVWTACWSVRQR